MGRGELTVGSGQLAVGGLELGRITDGDGGFRLLWAYCGGG